jgi:hypothetical protein
MVDPSTLNSRVKGSNLATGKEKMALTCFEVLLSWFFLDERSEATDDPV